MVTKFIQYMHLAIVEYYYSNLASDSCGPEVDHIWSNILRRYFRCDMHYGIEQRWPEPGSKRQVEFTIRYFKDGHPKKVVFIVHKRVEDEISGFSSEKVIEQLTNTYMKTARTGADENQGPEEIVYAMAIVAAGRYSRFYCLMPHSTTPTLRDDFPNTNDGRPLEFKHDEETIDEILLDILSKTQ